MRRHPRVVDGAKKNLTRRVYRHPVGEPRKRDIRTALKGIDTALKALEMFAKLSGQLQGPQHKHLHLHAEIPSREEAIEAARECLEVFAPQLLAAAVVPIDVSRSSEGEPPGESGGT